jgi:hypothetical protein
MSYNAPLKTGTKNVTDHIILFVMPQEEFFYRQTFHILNIYSILHPSSKRKFGRSRLDSWII